MKEKMTLPVGQWRDEIFKREKDGTVRLLERTDWKKNLITEPLTRLLAGLMANEGSFAGGVLYHALAEGDAAWDTSTPTPIFATTTLTNEIFRKTPDSITYIDGSGNASASVTNRIRVRTTFDFNDGPGLNGHFIRSQGLFGGDATHAAGTGYLIDVINHVKLFKDNTLSIVRTIDLTF